MKIHPSADLKGLATAAIERAYLDSKHLIDPLAGAWLLTDQAAALGEIAGLKSEVLPQIAVKALEGLTSGQNNPANKRHNHK